MILLAQHLLGDARQAPVDGSSEVVDSVFAMAMKLVA
jgi:hypothetical protein